MFKALRYASSGLVLLLVGALTCSPSLQAEDQRCSKPATDRLQIGLVLGGGGARGYAHLGVLARLEEMHIPYDYIAGTSMGSIVGGLLATGMEADELARIVRNADWDDLFKDQTSREDITFRRKTDDDLGLFGPKLGIGKNSSLLPKGVVSGQKIILMFESVASQRVNTANFDVLPIPFRAVATDIVTGDMVVIADGELSMAMRASMAVPAVFDPVRREGMLLVDGGLVRNLPVDVVRAMGAEVVIAVDVGTKLSSKDELVDALAILDQMSGMLTVSNTEAQIRTLGEQDVLIAPAIGDRIASADFDKLEEGIALGYAAADAMQDQLRQFSLPETEYRAWRQSLVSCIHSQPQVQFVHLDNQSRFSDAVIRELISIQPGKPLDLEQVNRDLSRIYGLGFIRQARFNIVEEEGQQGINITVRQDERGTQFIESGLDLNFSGRGTDFNIRAGYLNTALDDRGSELRVVAQFGETPGVFSDYYRPLNDGLKYSVNPSIGIFRRPLLVYDDQGNALAEVELDEAGAAVTLARDLGRYARLSAGVTRYAGSMDITIGEPGLEPFSFNGAELFAKFELDRLDDRYMPTRGTLSNVKYTYSSEDLGADAAFEQVEAAFFGTHTFGPHNLMLGAQFNTSLDEEVPIYAWYTGGGFLNMSGFDPNSLVGPHFGQLMAGYRYQLGPAGFLPAYVGMTVEYGNATWDRADVFSDGLLNGSIYLAYNSPLGPIYFGVGWSEHRDPVYGLMMGTIFGPRSLGRR